MHASCLSWLACTEVLLTMLVRRNSNDDSVRLVWGINQVSIVWEGLTPGPLVAFRTCEVSQSMKTCQAQMSHSLLQAAKLMHRAFERKVAILSSFC